MEKLGKLLKNTDDAKLIYVPGGTDSPFLYGFGNDELIPDTDKAGKAINLHKDIYQLAEGLIVAGIGGSVPAVFHSNKEGGQEDE